MPSRPSFPAARVLVPAVVLALGLAVALLASPGCASKHSSPSPGGTAKEMNSGDIGNGGIYAHTFATAGTYAYHCVHHGVMTGTVTVDASAAGMTADVNIAGIAPFPAATVKPGGTVTWHNNSAMVHTVTSN